MNIHSKKWNFLVNKLYFEMIKFYFFNRSNNLNNY